MQLSFSFLAVFTAAASLSLVSAHPAQQLKRVTTTTTTTPPPSPTSTTALGDAGIPTHASTVTDSLPAAIKTTPPSSCTFFFSFLFLFSIPPPACSLSSTKEGKNFFLLLNNVASELRPSPQNDLFYPKAKNESKSLVPIHNFFSFFFLSFSPLHNRKKHNSFLIQIIPTLLISMLGGSGPPGAAIKGRVLACPYAW